MSSNQGKDGEMVMAVIVASMAHRENGVDFTRPSVTNSADMGLDICIHHPPGFLPKFLGVANGTIPPSLPDTTGDSPAKATQKTRVDKKSTSGKLGKGTIEKFIADTHKHPDCIGHVLAGGSCLTKPAERVFDEAKQNFQEGGKILAYVDNDGIRRLAAYYPPPGTCLAPGDSQAAIMPDGNNKKELE